MYRIHIVTAKTERELAAKLAVGQLSAMEDSLRAFSLAVKQASRAAARNLRSFAGDLARIERETGYVFGSEEEGRNDHG